MAAAVIAFSAFRLRVLTAGGALAAVAIGAAVFGSGSFTYAFVLLAFFIPSVALSRIGRARKRALVDVGKTGARDGAQVLANGGIAAACALLSLHGGLPFAVAFAGACAAAAADTFGTEIGTIAGGTPRSILTLRPLATGLSGGVTVAGSVAECAGALLVAAVAAAAGIHEFWSIFAGGAAGALVDSVLGASVQALRWCPQCQRACETEPHACGANTTLVRGFEFISNDAVNVAATGAGALAAYYAYVFSR